MKRTPPFARLILIQFFFDALLYTAGMNCSLFYHFYVEEMGYTSQLLQLKLEIFNQFAGLIPKYDLQFQSFTNTVTEH